MQLKLEILLLFFVSKPKYTLYSFYDGFAGLCEFKNIGPEGLGAKLKGFVALPPNENDLQAAVAEIGPISVAIYMNENFLSYSGGWFLIFKI